MNLWPVEHFFPPFFFQISTDLEKTGEKSVQNWSEVLFFGSTSYEIHSLVCGTKQQYLEGKISLVSL